MLAAAWQERYAGELAALARLKAPQRRDLMQLMAEMQGDIDATVAEAAAAWADLAPAARRMADKSAGSGHENRS